MAHGQWTEIEARGVLDAWKKSGKPIWSYAKSRGLVPQRLYEEVVLPAEGDPPKRRASTARRGSCPRRRHPASAIDDLLPAPGPP
jgi:hypothetical protein